MTPWSTLYMDRGSGDADRICSGQQAFSRVGRGFRAGADLAGSQADQDGPEKGSGRAVDLDMLSLDDADRIGRDIRVFEMPSDFTGYPIKDKQ